MRGAIGLLAVLPFLAAVTQGATIHLNTTVSSGSYTVGDPVCWTISVCTSVDDNRGVALLGVDLDDLAGEQLAAVSCFGPAFRGENGFVLSSPGTPSLTPPRLQDIFAGQINRVLDVANDGCEHVFAQGSYYPICVGHHTLVVSPRSANYWPGELGNAQSFEVIDLTCASVDFSVAPHPGDANMNCAVSIGDLAIMAAHWQESGMCWTDGDFTGDGWVGIGDLSILAANWNWYFTGGPGGSVPEPSISCLLLAASPLLPILRRNP